MAGLVLAVYAISPTRFAHDWHIAFAAAATAAGLGLWAFRFKSIRGIAVGWTVASFGFVIAVVVILIRATIG
jgi:hypothetical protein